MEFQDKYQIILVSLLFFAGCGQSDRFKTPADYILTGEILMYNSDVTIVDTGYSIEHDTLEYLSNELLNMGAKVIVINHFLSNADYYFASLDTLLSSRINVIIPEEVYLDGDTIQPKPNIYPNATSGNKRFRGLKLGSKFDLATSFPKKVNKNGTMIEHIATKVVEQYHPRYRAFKNRSEGDDVELRYFGDESMFTIVSLDSIIHHSTADYKKSIDGKIVIIGPLGNRRYYTPVRYVLNSYKDEPDMSSTLLLANAILTLMNYEFLEDYSLTGRQ